MVFFRVTRRGVNVRRSHGHEHISDRGSFRLVRRPESGRLSSLRNLTDCCKVPWAPRNRWISSARTICAFGAIRSA